MAILINTKLDVDCTKIAADPNGRFLKIRIKNRNNENSINISSIYLEPNGHLENINEIAMESEIIGGDLNNAPTQLNKYDVFHLKNIEIKEIIDLGNRDVIDHPILIGKTNFKTNKISINEKVTILNMINVNENNELIKKYKEINETISFKNPHKIIEIKSYEQKIDIQKFGEEYIRLKEEAKIKNKIEWTTRYKNINTIISQGKLNQETWAKINKTLLQNKKSNIWNKTANTERITNDFKKLYKHNEEGKNWDINKISDVIKETINILNNNINYYSIEDKLYTPFSKAMDYYGFSQRIIIETIKENNIKEEINNFSTLLRKMKTIEDIKYLIHNKVRTILFKKKIDADEQKNLRTISIIPAWLMVLEKIAKPIIQKIINEHIIKNQFGFRPKSDCGLAKAMIFYNAQKYKYNKALLIDIKKAYDTVNLEILEKIIDKTFINQNIKTLLLNFILFYKGLILIINDTEIHTTRGLPQGSSLSPIFFNLYINDILKELNRDKDVHTQAYADDIIIQSNNLQKLQNSYDQAKTEFKKIGLEINPEKCELITDNESETIIDSNNNEEIIEIKGVKSAKYLGQIINEHGVPTKNITEVNFGHIKSILIKQGDLTKTSKIRIFQVYMRSKINHLLPLIILTGGIETTWKTIRKFIFDNIIEYKTLPRESASVFGLGYYELIIRPIKKLIERNYEYTKNEDEDKMLNDSLKDAFKFWLIAEPKHNDNINELIVNNIEGTKKSNLKELDEALKDEKIERIFRNHNIKKEIVNNLKKVKSPSIIILISNEPEHEIKQKIVQYITEEETEKKNMYKDKINNIISKLKVIIEYIKNYKVIDDNDINKNNNNIEEQIIDYTIKEIKIKKRWNNLKEQWKTNINDFTENLINYNINKDKENINTTEVYKLIEKAREAIAVSDKRLYKEIEIAIELEEQNEFLDKIIKKNSHNIENKRGPGRPKIIKTKDKNQSNICDYFIKNKNIIN